MPNDVLPRTLECGMYQQNLLYEFRKSASIADVTTTRFRGWRPKRYGKPQTVQACRM
jgi:hypothetical protein